MYEYAAKGCEIVGVSGRCFNNQYCYQVQDSRQAPLSSCGKHTVTLASSATGAQNSACYGRQETDRRATASSLLQSTKRHGRTARETGKLQLRVMDSHLTCGCSLDGCATHFARLFPADYRHAGSANHGHNVWFAWIKCFSAGL